MLCLNDIVLVSKCCFHSMNGLLNWNWNKLLVHIRTVRNHIFGILYSRPLNMDPSFFSSSRFKVSTVVSTSSNFEVSSAVL